MRKNDNIFWVSYSDFMTSMFFIMLVLFVLSIGYLKIENRKNIEIIKKNKVLIERQKKLIDTIEKQKKKLTIENDRLKRILQIEKQFKPLENDSSFLYLPKCQKYVIKEFLGIEIFHPMSTEIKPEYIRQTIEIGHKIESFLQMLNQQNPNLSYLLVIEGNAANDPSKPWSKDEKTAYIRSYKRALAVYLLWQKNNINFRQYNVEVMINGSGFNGLCRDNVERYNKRFSIQIIPKIKPPIKNEKK